METPISIVAGQQLIINAARPEDAEPICRVTAETWIDTYPNEDLGITRDMIGIRHYDPDGGLSKTKVAGLMDALLHPSDRYSIYVARLGAEVVGVSANKITETGKHKLNTLFVLPSTQSLGIGSRLLEQSLGWHGQNDIYNNVATYNHRALRLYVKYGFIVVGPIAAEDQMQFDNGVILPEVEMLRKANAQP